VLRKSDQIQHEKWAKCESSDVHRT
jgi:hypothetical protein